MADERRDRKAEEPGDLRQTADEGAERKADLLGQRAEKVDLNTASAIALTGVPGIGASTAQKIVDYRESNGPFNSVDDLRSVDGVTEDALRTLRDQTDVFRK